MNPSGTPGKYVPRRDRVNCMREFLKENFSEEFLRSGVIFDVAGGKGDLSWLLENVEGYDCAVVDPRRTDHSKLTMSALWLLEHPEKARMQARQGQVLATLLVKPPFRMPKHLKVYLDAEFLNAFDTPMTSTEWQTFWNRANAKADAEEGTRGHHQPTKVEEEDSPIVAERVLESEKARSLVNSACIVLGFHPDQATEPCIDLALALKIPFVVCPCCVFPSLFPMRRLKESDRNVSNYEDFVLYLKEKDDRIRIGRLNFESRATGHGAGLARNLVLYMLPQDFDH